MNFNLLIIIIAFTGIVSTSAIPEMDTSISGMDTSPISPLVKRDAYTCPDGLLCKSVQVESCDHAVNTLIRNDQKYGASGYAPFILLLFRIEH